MSLVLFLLAIELHFGIGWVYPCPNNSNILMISYPIAHSL